MPRLLACNARMRFTTLSPAVLVVAGCFMMLGTKDYLASGDSGGRHHMRPVRYNVEVTIVPVLLGAGIPLLPPGAPRTAMRLS